MLVVVGEERQADDEIGRGAVERLRNVVGRVTALRSTSRGCGDIGSMKKIKKSILPSAIIARPADRRLRVST
jgi:hypothetical protein